MSDLIKRAGSSVIFVLATLICILYDKFSFGFFFLLLSMAAANEFYTLMDKWGYSTQRYIGVLGSGYFFFSFFLYRHGFDSEAILAVNLLFPFIIMVVEMFVDDEHMLGNSGTTVLGMYYSAIPFTLLNYITIPLELPSFSPLLILGFIFIIWANDTFAYFTGSLIGKHKLYEKVSPGKTWEGFIGGLVFAILTGYLYSLFYPEVESIHWLVIAAIISVFGTLGDLVESKLKRKAGVKDSGKLLPGHGGILDRFDALIFSIPFVFVYILFVV